MSEYTDMDSNVDIEEDIEIKEESIDLNEMEFEESDDITDNSNDFEIEADDSEINTDVETVLYIVVDKVIPGLHEYIHGCGLAVTKVIYNITDARNSMLMQSKNTRMVIMETGTGVFMSTKVRQELIDMLGLADNDSRILVAYTNKVIKDDAIKAIGKNNKYIIWEEYSNTVNTVADILKLGEHYVTDENIQLNKKNTEDLLNYIGINDGEQLPEKIEIVGFSSEAVLNNVIDVGESIKQYKPNI